MEKKKYDIFISHAHLDAEIAINLCIALEEQGLSCWIAPRNVGVGHYSTSIIEGIENSKALILLLSSNSNNSMPVLNELESATNNHLLLIPVRIEDIMPTKSIGYYIRTNNWFDNFHPKSIEDFETFVDTVKATIDSNHTSTKKFIIPTTKRTKESIFKSFTFVLLFLTFMFGIFSFNSYAMITQQKDLIEQQYKIIEQYLKEKEKYKNNPKIISQAEHIKDIAGYREAIEYFRRKDKKIFYANYKNIKLLYFSGHGMHINDDNKTMYDGTGSIIDTKFSLNIKTVPISAKIKILNIKEKYKNNIYLSKGIYNIEISNNGYSKKIFKIKLDKDSNLTVHLEKNSLTQEIK